MPNPPFQKSRTQIKISFLMRARASTTVVQGRDLILSYLWSSAWVSLGVSDKNSLYLLFIHPRAPNLISLRSAGTMSA